jgi:methionine-rich copper-binding protein CopC
MRKLFTFLALGVAMAATLALATTASAHAPIKFIKWDSDTNPTALTASTDNREMEATPGSFYLRVYNSGGGRVDNGDATITPDRLSLIVTLLPGLPSGTYRVDWLTTSTDGEVISGSESVPLPGSFESTAADDDEADAADTGSEPTSAPSETIAPPATGDGGLLSQDGDGFAASKAMAAAALVVVASGGLALAYRRR